VLDERNFEESSLPVHIIMLAVVSGVLGVVLAGFGGWHVSLACRGLTTIECLEKTRYLSPVRKAMKADWAAHHAHGEQGEMPGYSVEEGGERSFEGPSGRPNFAQQLRDIHANILPGVTRPEEGAESDTEAPQLVSAPSSQHGTTRQMTYHQMEQQRARDRYEAYLDEQDSAKLPNAFDHGWKANLSHLFGPRPLLWALPICNTTGDGWAWEASEKWLEVRERVSREREEQRRREAAAGWGHGGRQSQDLAAAAGRPTTRDDPEARYAAQKHYLSSGSATYPGADGGGRRSPRSPGYQSKADRVLGRSPDQYSEDQLSQGVNLQTLKPRSPQNGLEGLGLNDSDVDEYPSSEEEAETPKADKPILGRQWSGASGKFGSGGIPQVKLGQGQIPTPRREREDDEESVD
jgi:palmitoyltransferase